MTLHDNLFNVVPMIVIPYITKEPSREKAFTEEMEKASILCLSEVKRKKPSVLRESGEETECIAKLHYPLWAIPWRKKCILVDGLGLASTTMSHNQIPSVQDFTENLKSSYISFSLFKKTLVEHDHIFDEFSSAEKVEMKALISDSSVLESFSSLIEQSKSQGEISETDVVMVSNVHGKVEIENTSKDFIHEWQRIQTDIDGLGFALRVLKEETDNHKEKASKEIELIKGDYDNKISIVKKEVDKKIMQLDKEKKKEVEKAEKLVDKELKKFDVEKRRFNQKLNELRHSLDITLTQKRVQKHKYPKRSTTRIDNRISLFQEKIRQVNSELHRIMDMQKKSRIRGQQEIRRIEERHRGLVAKEMEKIKVLEQSKNLEISKKKDEIGEIEALAKKIEAQINNLISQKVKDRETLDGMMFQLEAEEPLLIAIPFYVVQYKLGEKARIDLYQPMTAASYEGILKRIQKALFSFSLESRMQILLSPRSSSLNTVIFSNLQKGLKIDLALKEQILKLAYSANLFVQTGFKDQVFKGLAELESEGWLNSKEKENILSIVMHD